MSVDGFEIFLKESPQALNCVKPICEKIWGILFLYMNDGLSDSSEKLYSVEAFDNAIADMA